jgi:hypothetical protein
MNFGMEIVRCGPDVVMVWLHGAVDPAEADWEATMTRVRRLKAEVDGDLDRIRSLVVSDGGAPNSRQRTQLLSDILEGRTELALVTGSLTNPIKRGIAAAIGWLNPHFRAFTPSQGRQALIHLRCVAPADEDRIWQTLLELQVPLPPNEALEKMAESLGRPSPALGARARLA